MSRRACYVVGVQQYRKALGLPTGTVILSPATDEPVEYVYLHIEHPELPELRAGDPLPIVCAQYVVVGREHVFEKWRITGHVGDD